MTKAFNRSDYFNITDVIKTYKITSKAYQKLLEAHKIPSMVRHVQLGTYTCTALYAPKDDVIHLMLKLGIQKR